MKFRHRCFRVSGSVAHRSCATTLQRKRYALKRTHTRYPISDTLHPGPRTYIVHGAVALRIALARIGAVVEEEADRRIRFLHRRKLLHNCCAKVNRFLRRRSKRRRRKQIVGSSKCTTQRRSAPLPPRPKRKQTVELCNYATDCTPLQLTARLTVHLYNYLYNRKIT